MKDTSVRRQNDKKVIDLHGCCQTVSNLGAGQGSRGKSIKIESLTEIVKSNVRKKVREATFT